MTHELVIPEAPTQLATIDAGSSLTGWLLDYCHAEVAGSPKTTLQAKKRDFQLFLDVSDRTPLPSSFGATP